MSENECYICNKFYKKYLSLWNHNKRYHKNNLVQNNPILTQINHFAEKKLTQINPKLTQDTYKCRYCEKSYNFAQGRWRHEKKCKTEQEKTELIELKKEVTQLKEIINKHPTIQNNITNTGTINIKKTMKENIEMTCYLYFKNCENY
jgi:hypothetical protein